MAFPREESADVTIFSRCCSNYLSLMQIKWKSLYGAYGSIKIWNYKEKKW